MSTQPKTRTTRPRNPRRDNARSGNKQPENLAKKVDEKQPSDDEDDDELCFICTESIKTYAVAECDHRTCFRCTLRLRALYDTRNCAYCKAEQKVVIFTKDAEKPFENYVPEDTPFVDKKLNIRFETEEMYKESMHMLDYNCPQDDCRETCKNWGELKQHVRKTHNLNICDLCSRHKKIFPYEHTLYTSAQLTKHHREGDKEFNKDDETGFSGHPECAFCRTRFFGDDELFVHCRDQHEQCFLCVRNGKRHEYYANYASLEDHFKSDHYVCVYPQCVEKKFVVFDSPIDLKAHEVEVHGESTANLQRSMQTQSRQLELNFQYESFRNRDNNRRGKKKESNSQQQQSGSSSSRTDEFPSMSQVNEALAASTDTASTNTASTNSASTSKSSINTQPRIVPGARKDKGKGKAIQKPAGFGSLSRPEIVNDSGGGGGGSASSGSKSELPLSDPTVAQHTAFLSKVGDMLQSKAKVAEFRSLTSAFRKSTLGGEDYVNQVVALTSNNVEKSAKIFKGVEDLLDIDDKKWELIRCWRNKHTAMTNFPALDVRERPAAPAPSRVLVIKPKQNKSIPGAKSKNVWDKVATAANVANNKASRPSSAKSSIRSSPQTSRPVSPVNTGYRQPSKTPWSGGSSSTTTSNATASATVKKEAFPTLKPKAFPSLPSAAPKHQMILNMRKQGQTTSNAWSGNNSSNEDISEASETSSASNSSNKKKKGRKANVLFRVGL